ncbi:MAG: glycoside hydrolase family 32 protein, partial [Saprospiraceae bacterium]|nr:glycoside hydrolase family 32 protein [Saprospiraceae bacterium]
MDMTLSKILLSLLLLVSSIPAEEERPLYHFTAEKNWINDPNGMVYYEGEYHLFYQYNPLGDKWGHMSWGHAMSTDLISWSHLPLAIPETDDVMAFSGSAVVDWHNTSDFGKDGKPPLVAIYTGHRQGRQDQRLAFSNDRGRTWTQY